MKEQTKENLIGYSVVLGIILSVTAVTFLSFVGIFALTEGPQVVTVDRQENSQPGVIMEVLDPSLESFAPAWKAEIARRFPHAVGVLVHGGDFIEGQWIVGANLSPHHLSTTKEVVEHYQKLYPDRTIVLLACNTGHLKLGIPGVYYFKSSVWCIPDRGLGQEDKENAEKLLDGTVQTRWQQDSDVNGNIYEAVKE
jgi:hypothetical protein